MNIRINLWTMSDVGEKRLPHVIVEELGLKYEAWQSHPIADQIHLINVDPKTMPAELPKFMEVF